jgi:hypothetical protein
VFRFTRVGAWRATIHHRVIGSNLIDGRYIFISNDMSKIDQSSRSPARMVDRITALRVAPFGD